MAFNGQLEKLNTPWETVVNRAIAELTSAIIDPSLPFETIARLTLEQAKKLTDSQHGYASVIDPGNGDNVVYTLTQMMGKECKLDTQDQRIVFPPNEEGQYPCLWGFALNNREAFYTNEPHRHEASTGLPEGHIPLNNFLSVPVVFDTQLVGQLALANSPLGYSECELEAVKKIAELYGLLISRIRMEAELSLYRFRLEDMVEKRTNELQEMNQQLEEEIAERARIEDALRTERDFSENLINTAHALIVLLNNDARIVRINPHLEEVSGYTQSEVQGKSWLDVFVPEKSRQKTHAVIEQLRKDLNFVSPHINQLATRKGYELTVEWYGKILKDKNNKPIGFLSIGQDVSERLKVEKELEKQRAFLKQVIDTDPNLIFVRDRNDNYTLVNQAMAKAIGKPVEVIINQRQQNVTHNEYDASRFHHEDRIVLEKGEAVYHSEEYVPFPSGKNFWLQVNKQPIFGDNGKATHILGVMVDISERKAAEEALLQNEATLKALVDANPEVFLMTDKDGIVLAANEATAQKVNTSLENLLGKNIFDVMPPEISKKRKECFDEVVQNCQPLRYEEISPGLSYETYLQPIFDEQKQVSKIAILAIDITEKKHQQRIQEAVVRVSSALRPAQYRQDILNTILDEILTIFKSDGASLVTCDPETNEDIIEMAVGCIAHTTGMHLSNHTGVISASMKNGEPYLNNDLLTNPCFENYQNIKGLPTCMIGAPLSTKDKHIGGLWVGREQPYRQDDLDVLVAISEIAANAIQRNALHEDVQRQLRRVEALHTIDQAITSDLNLSATLKVFLDQVADQLDVDAVDILLLDTPTQTLRCEAEKGFSSDALRYIEINIGEDLPGDCAYNQRLRHINDLSAINLEDFPRAQVLAVERFVEYYCTPLVSKGKVNGILEIFNRKVRQIDKEWLAFLETLGTQAAIAIDDAQNTIALRRTNLELETAYDITLAGWAKALELRDNETEGHSRRVTELTIRLAKAIGVPDNELINIRRGALLHDIGKMGVPDSILHKKGPLTKREWEIMRQHPGHAYRLLSPISYLSSALDIPYCHHERWDGGGYPRGLRGEEIPLSARIFAVVDVWDALLSDRPYRASWSQEEVVSYIKENSGSHFDPAVVTVFLRIVGSSQT